MQVRNMEMSRDCSSSMMLTPLVINMFCMFIMAGILYNAARSRESWKVMQFISQPSLATLASIEAAGMKIKTEPPSCFLTIVMPVLVTWMYDVSRTHNSRRFFMNSRLSGTKVQYESRSRQLDRLSIGNFWNGNIKRNTAGTRGA